MNHLTHVMNTREPVPQSALPSLTGTLRHIVMLALVTAVLPACGSGQRVHDEASVAAADCSESHAQLVRDAEGFLRPSPCSDLRPGDWYGLRPAQWPEPEAPAPIVGYGHIAERAQLGTYAVQWVLQSDEPPRNLEVIELQKPPSMDTTKSSFRIDSVGDGRLVFPVGSQQGVAVDDLYFAFPVAGSDDISGLDRLGEARPTLLQVTEVEEDRSVATVRSGAPGLAPGDLAVFANIRHYQTAPEYTIALAVPNEGDGPQSERTRGLTEALGNALLSIFSDYGITNVRIETIDASIDPTAEDAEQRAEEHAPATGAGTFYFGRFEGPDFILNYTTFGDLPAIGYTVGILPGGLTIPNIASTDELAAAMAPGLAAAATGMRGEHALAISLLEDVLAEHEPPAHLRFHLREQLASQYAAIGAADEGLLIMNEDIAETRESGDVRSELNALSIRTMLAAELGLTDLELATHERYIETATPEMPRSNVEYQRLQLARYYARTGNIDGSDGLLRPTVSWADQNTHPDVFASAMSAMAENRVSAGEPLIASVMLEELLASPLAPGPVEQAIFRARLAMLAAEDEDERQTRRYLQAAFDDINGSPDASTAAERTVAIYAASALRELGRHAEAQRYLEASVAASFELLDIDAAADLLGSLASVEFEAIGQSRRRGPSSRLLIDGIEHMSRSMQTLLALGRYRDAALTATYLSSLADQLGDLDRAELLLEQARALAYAVGNRELLSQIAGRRAELAAAHGDPEGAQLAEQQRRLWEIPSKGDEGAGEPASE